MKKSRFLIINMLVIISFLLTACSRPASTPIPEAPEEGTPVSSNEQLEAYLTAVAEQTVSANQGGGTGGGANATDEAAMGTATAGGPSGTQGATEEVEPTATATPFEVDHDIPDTYELKKGEFPYCIARRYNVDIGTLLAINGLDKGQNYYPGLKLKIPKDGKKFQGNRMLRTHPTKYTSSSGDTFYSIACLFGDVFPSDIANANGMSAKDSIPSGKELKIP